MARRFLVAVTLGILLASTAVAGLAWTTLAGQGRAPALPGTEGSALALRPIADARAADWRPDALLVRAFATEGTPVDARVDPPFLWDTSNDPLVANGLAIVWSYAYVSPERPGRLFVASVAGDGTLVYARDLVDPHHGCCVAVAVAEEAPARADAHEPHAEHASHDREAAKPASLQVALDAAEALAAVADHPAFATFADDHPVFQAFHEVSGDREGRAAWRVAFRTASWFYAEGVVDAATGEVLSVHAWPDPSPPPPCSGCPLPQPPVWQPQDYHVDSSGTLAPGFAFGVNLPVESRAHLERLRVEATVEGNLPALEEVTLRVVDGWGREVGRATTPDPLVFETAATSTEGMWRAEVFTRGLALREIPVRIVGDVLYRPAEADAPLPATERFVGEIQGFGGMAYYALAPRHDGASARVTLAWDRVLPTENLELVLLDPYMNAVARARGGDVDPDGSVVEIDVPSSTWEACCWTLAVRATAPGLAPIAYTLDLAWSVPDGAPRGHGHPD